MSLAIGSDSYHSIATDMASNTLKTNGLETKLKGELATDDELMDVCKSFESYMLEQVFKGMKKTVPESEDDDSPYLQQFGDMMYQEYAKAATEGPGIGIAQMLYESMKRN